MVRGGGIQGQDGQGQGQNVATLPMSGGLELDDL